jgi:hypothetical protein
VHAETRVAESRFENRPGTIETATEAVHAG